MSSAVGAGDRTILTSVPGLSTFVAWCAPSSDDAVVSVSVMVSSSDALLLTATSSLSVSWRLCGTPRGAVLNLNDPGDGVGQVPGASNWDANAANDLVISP